MLKVAIAAILLCVPLCAEEISGVVVEAGGGRSPGASVTIKSRSGVVRRDLVADQDGKYRATDLPADFYTVTARSVRTGNAATVRAVVHDGQNMDLPIRLSETLAASGG